MELFHRFQYPMPDGTISESGKVEIERLFNRQRLPVGEWADLNREYSLSYLPSLPPTWEWDWKVMRGEYRGTFPKRVAQYLKKRFNIKCPESFLAELGDLARRHSNEGEIYEFEFDNELNWYAGQYGDDDSCFYDDRPGAFQMIRDGGGMGICFFEPGTNRGIGRAFVYDATSYHVIWNGYGLLGDATFRIAQIFALWRGEAFKKIEVRNRDEIHGVLWINAGGFGYAVGKIEVLDTLQKHNFGWENIYLKRCYDCGEVHSDDDMRHGPDDRPYCDGCFDANFAYCAICDEAYDHENLSYVDDQDVCEWCLRDHYENCTTCGEHVYRRSTRRRGEKWYCTRCYDQLPDPRKK